MKIRFILLYVLLFLMIGTGCTIKRPEIAEEALTGSAQLMEGNQEIEDAEVIVEDNRLKFNLLLVEDMDVSQERMRELGEDFLNFLGGYVVNDELKGPSNETYGEIYYFYDVEVIVEGFREVLARGTMKKGSNELIWE